LGTTVPPLGDGPPPEAELLLSLDRPMITATMPTTTTITARPTHNQVVLPRLDLDASRTLADADG
jgi:hypothetical protein